MNRIFISAVLFCASTSFAADPLPRAKPEAVGMSSARLARIVPALTADVDQGRIPGAMVLQAIDR